MYGYLFQVEKAYLTKNQWLTEEQLSHQLSDLAKDNHYWDYIDLVPDQMYQEDALVSFYWLLPQAYLRIEDEGRTVTFLPGFSEAYSNHVLPDGVQLSTLMQDRFYVVEGVESELTFHDWVIQLMQIDIPYMIGSIFEYHQ